MFIILTRCPREDTLKQYQLCKCLIYLLGVRKKLHQTNTNCAKIYYTYWVSVRRYAETIPIVQMFIILTGCPREYTRKQYQLCKCLLYLLGFHKKICGNNTNYANVYNTYWVSTRRYGETIPIVQIFIILTRCLRIDTLKQYQLCKCLIYLLVSCEKIRINNTNCANV